MPFNRIYIKKKDFKTVKETSSNEEGRTISRFAMTLGLSAGVASFFLWVIFSFFNPYSNTPDIEPIINTFIMLFLPACLAIVSTLKSKRVLMLIAFIWSLPMSLYVAMTPSIFAWFGVTSFAYLISFSLMRSKK